MDPLICIVFQKNNNEIIIDGELKYISDSLRKKISKHFHFKLEEKKVQKDKKKGNGDDDDDDDLYESYWRNLIEIKKDKKKQIQYRYKNETNMPKKELFLFLKTIIEEHRQGDDAVLYWKMFLSEHIATYSRYYFKLCDDNDNENIEKNKDERIIFTNNNDQNKMDES